MEVMKSIHQIAKECGLGYSQIVLVVKNEGITPAKKKGHYHYFDKYQEDIIHERLYLTSACNEVIFESKMHEIPEPEQEPFEEFKKRVYGQKK